jgi:hypothetical protein
MSPIPGEPLDPRQPDLTTADGRRVRLKIPGLTPLGAERKRPEAEDDDQSSSGGGGSEGLE